MLIIVSKQMKIKPLMEARQGERAGGNPSQQEEKVGLAHYDCSFFWSIFSDYFFYVSLLQSLLFRLLWSTFHGGNKVNKSVMVILIIRSG